MTPKQVERIRERVCQVIPRYVDWLSDRIEANAAFTGRALATARDSFLDDWDRVLAPAEFQDAWIVVGLLEVGRLRCPYYGDMLRFLREESSNIAAARRKRERWIRERRELSAWRAKSIEAQKIEGSRGPSIAEQFRAALRERNR